MVDNLNAEAKITLDATEYVDAGKKVEGINKGIEDSADRASGSIDNLETSLGGSVQAAEKASGSTRQLADNTEQVAVSTRGLAATRYALYDVATTWGTISAATLGAATAVESVGAGYEYAFSSVQRVTQTAGEAAGEMKQDLKDLASTIHEEFDSISEVATLGGQMGVAKEEIKEFTRNVTMFGATTSATVQETAMGFGRLAQLTKAGSDAWESIGSAIYQVGINSVATESRILKVSQEIATAGNLAGFTTDEVIGLAGALASLGVQPERARGNILRVFSEIDKAIAEGGESLDNFGRISGMSAQEFADAWSSTPEKAFRSLLEGLNRAQEAGANLGQEIRNLGIVAVRDVQTMQQLANNTEVYASSMMHANEAYRDGTALMDAYGVRSDTVVGKLQILNNVVKNIMDSLSSNTAIKFFLDGLIEIGRAVENILKYPLAAAVGSVGVALLGLVGITAAVRAGMAAMQASILAIQLAVQNLNLPAIQGLDLSLKGLLTSLRALTDVNRGVTTSTAQATGAIRAQTTATQQLTVATNQANVAQGAGVANSGRLANAARRVGDGFKFAGGAVATLVGSLRFVPQLAIISGIVWGASKAFNAWSNRAEHAKNVAQDFFGSLSGLGDAIAQDTATYEEAGEYMRLLAVNTEDGTIAWDSAKLSQEELEKAVRNTTDAVNEQIVAMGEATEEALKQSILESDNFAESWEKIKSSAKSAGVDIKTVVDGLMTGDTAGLLTPLVDQAEADELRLKEVVLGIQAEIDGLRSEAQFLLYGTEEETQAILDQIAVLEQRLEAKQRERTENQAQLNELSELSLATRGLSEITEDLIANQTAQAEFLGILGEESRDASDATDDLTKSLEGAFDALNRAHEVEGSMESLVNTILDGGVAIDDMSAEGRASFNALMDTVNMFATQADGDIWAFGLSLAEMFAYTEGASIQFGSEVDFLRAQMVAAFNQQWGLSLDISSAQGSIRTFIQEAIKAIQVRAELERTAIQGAMAKARETPSLQAAIAYSNEAAQARANLDTYNQQIAQLQGIEASLGKVEKAGQRAANNFYNPPGRKSGGGGRGRKSPVGRDAKEAAEEVRTLSDYVKDLNSVTRNAFDFRFGKIIATDDLEAAKRSLRELRDDALKRVADAFEALADARQRVVDLRVSLQDLNATVQGLEADRSKLQYFYEIAVEYGDTKRAEQLAAELAKVTADLAKAENDRTKTNKELADAQAGVSDASKELSQAQADSKRTLTENTQSSADQRKAVMDLVRAYQDQIIALADSGMNQKDLQRETEKLRKEFEKELRQLGYNRAEIKKYGDAFKDLSTIIKNIPPANVKANTNPAKRAIDEFLARTRKRTATVNVKATTPKIGSISGGTYRPSGVAVGSGGMSTPKITVGRGGIGGGVGSSMQMRDVGGFTGAGGQYSAKGVFHGGEYIFPKKDVNQRTGLPHADVMARMMVGTREFNSLMSGIAANSSQGSDAMFISGASAGFIQAVASAVRTQIVIGDKVIAGANSAANRRSTDVGAN